MPHRTASRGENDGVQHVLHRPRLLPDRPAGNDRRSRLVVVTRDLDSAVIEDILRASDRAA